MRHLQGRWRDVPPGTRSVRLGGGKRAAGREFGCPIRGSSHRGEDVNHWGIDLQRAARISWLLGMHASVGVTVYL
jgi:hypothetical protein